MQNWFILSLISAIGFGIIPLFLKSIQQTVAPQLVMAWYYSIVAVIMWFVVGFSSKIVIPDVRQSGLIVAVAIIAAIADLAIFIAYKFASNAGYPRSIQALSIVIATALSAVFYHQLPAPLGVVGTIFVFLGVILLSGIR